MLLLDAQNTQLPISTYATLFFSALAIAVQIFFNRRTLAQSRTIADAQRGDFQLQLKNQNESAFKYSSIQLATKFDDDFRQLTEERERAAKIILECKKDSVAVRKHFHRIKYDLSEVYDLFDTVAYYVHKGYMKPDVVHQYFYYWFVRYYAFYVIYKIQALARYEENSWNNLAYLQHQLDIVEVEQRHGKVPNPISEDELVRFFSEEGNYTPI